VAEEISKKTTTVEDANIVAFLAMMGYIAIPYICSKARPGQGSRIAWDIDADVSDTIKKYYHNEKVGVKDFVRSLKEVRTEMYNVKQMNNQLKKD
jgi:hypothetical protein